MNTCQFIVLSAIIAVSAAELQPWNGPFADHTLGQLVHETPEVAAARRHHETVFAKVKSALPELPPEEDTDMHHDNSHINHQLPQLQVVTHPPVELPQFVHHEITSPVPTDISTHTRWTGPLADHKLGQNVQETPEVAAARRHHETVFSKVKSALPELSEEDTDMHHDQLPQLQVANHPPTQLPYFVHHETTPFVSTEIPVHPRWTGLLADHNTVFSKVKSALTQFSSEEKTDMHHEQLQIATHSPTQLPHFVHHDTTPSVSTEIPVHPRWTGPLADHKLGQNVRETPEVEAARRLHETVYSKVKSVLPELPPEEEKQVQHAVPEVRQMRVFEPPQVEAARQAHLRALSEANLHLQRVNIHTFSTTTPPAVVHLNDYPVDTPEVAAAKLAHARAFAALVGH